MDMQIVGFDYNFKPTSVDDEMIDFVGNEFKVIGGGNLFGAHCFFWKRGSKLETITMSDASICEHLDDRTSGNNLFGGYRPIDTVNFDSLFFNRKLNKVVEEEPIGYSIFQKPAYIGSHFKNKEGLDFTAVGYGKIENESCYFRVNEDSTFNGRISIIAEICSDCMPL